MIGHRFGYQSGQDESSRQNPSAILKGSSFHVYIVSKICIKSTYQCKRMFVVREVFVLEKEGASCSINHKKTLPALSDSAKPSCEQEQISAIVNIAYDIFLSYSVYGLSIFAH